MIKFGSTVRLFKRLQIKFPSSVTQAHLVSSDLPFYTKTFKIALWRNEIEAKSGGENVPVAFTFIKYSNYRNTWLTN